MLLWLIHNFLEIAASYGDAAAFNPNKIKTLLADRVTTFLTNGRPAVLSCNQLY